MKRALVLVSAMLVAGAGMSAVGVSVAGAAGAAKHGPKLVAKPDSVMVNKKTTLTGTGFKPHKKVTIFECSATSWIVPQRICNTRNAVTIRANARGGFTIKITALVCPAPKSPPGPAGRVSRRGPAGFSKHCYLGVPKIHGVDQVFLIPSTRIRVTGP